MKATRKQWLNNQFTLVFIALFLFQIIYNFVNIKYGFPRNWFLFDPNDQFADILKTSDSFGVFDTWPGDNKYYLTWLLSVPPLQLFLEISFGYICKIGSYLFIKPLFIYIIAQAFVLLLIISLLLKYKIPKNMVFICLFNYGIFMFIDRGNISILTVPLLIIFFKSNNNRKSILALVLATSIKIVPLYFIIFCIIKFSKEYKNIFLFFAYLVCINIPLLITVSFMLERLNITYNLQTFLSQSQTYIYQYLILGHGWAYGSSGISLISYFLHVFTSLQKYIPLNTLTYLSFSLMLLSYILIYRNFQYFKNNTFELTLLLITTHVLFTPVTGDYYLAYFIIPLLFLGGTENKYLKIFIATLLAPKNYFYNSISIQIILNPLIMTAIIMIILYNIFLYNKATNQSNVNIMPIRK
jgi:hypothetical protein